MTPAADAPAVTAPSLLQRLAGHPGFVVENGIPRQKSVFTPSQAQTADVFGFKWAKRNTYESPAVQRASRDWLVERYALPNGQTIADLTRDKRVLDAGCGAGHSAILLFGEALNACQYTGVDISSAVDVAAVRFAEAGLRGEFLQASLMDLPDELGLFDVIFSEGVLHHTDSTEQAVRYLAGKLAPGGVFMFYVYRQKGPIREFTDDFIREKLAPMSDEQAWHALEPLTKLGHTLGALDIEIDIPEAIDVLDIPAGKINLQRLFYWHVAKAYYRPDWTLDEMNHINFDWFRPKNSHRQTPQAVCAWLEACGLCVLAQNVQEAGITIIAQKPA